MLPIRFHAIESLSSKKRRFGSFVHWASLKHSCPVDTHSPVLIDKGRVHEIPKSSKTQKHLPVLDVGDSSSKIVIICTSNNGEYMAGSLSNGSIFRWNRRHEMVHLINSPQQSQFDGEEKRRRRTFSNDIVVEGVKQIAISDDGSVIVILTTKLHLFLCFIYKSNADPTGIGSIEWFQIDADPLSLNHRAGRLNFNIGFYQDLIYGKGCNISHSVIESTTPQDRTLRVYHLTLSFDHVTYRPEYTKKSYTDADPFNARTQNRFYKLPRIEPSMSRSLPSISQSIKPARSPSPLQRRPSLGGSFDSGRRSRGASATSPDFSDSIQEDTRTILRWDPTGTIAAVVVNGKGKEDTCVVFTSTAHDTYLVVNLQKYLAPFFSDRSDIISVDGIISDLSWSPDGLFLALSTFDGYFCLLTRLGHPISLVLADADPSSMINLLFEPENHRRLSVDDGSHVSISFHPTLPHIICSDGHILRIFQFDCVSFSQLMKDPLSDSVSLALIPWRIAISHPSPYLFVHMSQLIERLRDLAVDKKPSQIAIPGFNWFLEVLRIFHFCMDSLHWNQSLHDRRSHIVEYIIAIYTMYVAHQQHRLALHCLNHGSSALFRVYGRKGKDVFFKRQYYQMRNRSLIAASIMKSFSSTNDERIFLPTGFALLIDSIVGKPKYNPTQDAAPATPTTASLSEGHEAFLKHSLEEAFVAYKQAQSDGLLHLLALYCATGKLSQAVDLLNTLNLLPDEPSMRIKCIGYFAAVVLGYKKRKHTKTLYIIPPTAINQDFDMDAICDWVKAELCKESVKHKLSAYLRYPVPRKYFDEFAKSSGYPDTLYLGRSISAIGLTGEAIEYLRECGHWKEACDLAHSSLMGCVCTAVMQHTIRIAAKALDVETIKEVFELALSYNIDSQILKKDAVMVILKHMKDTIKTLPIRILTEFPLPFPYDFRTSEFQHSASGGADQKSGSQSGASTLIFCAGDIASIGINEDYSSLCIAAKMQKDILPDTLHQQYQAELDRRSELTKAMYLAILILKPDVPNIMTAFFQNRQDPPDRMLDLHPSSNTSQPLSLSFTILQGSSDNKFTNPLVQLLRLLARYIWFLHIRDRLNISFRRREENLDMRWSRYSFSFLTGTKAASQAFDSELHLTYNCAIWARRLLFFSDVTSLHGIHEMVLSLMTGLDFESQAKVLCYMPEKFISKNLIGRYHRVVDALKQGSPETYSTLQSYWNSRHEYAKYMDIWECEEDHLYEGFIRLAILEPLSHNLIKYPSLDSTLELLYKTETSHSRSNLDERLDAYVLSDSEEESLQTEETDNGETTSIYEDKRLQYGHQLGDEIAEAVPLSARSKPISKVLPPKMDSTQNCPSYEDAPESDTADVSGKKLVDIKANALNEVYIDWPSNDTSAIISELDTQDLQISLDADQSETRSSSITIHNDDQDDGVYERPRGFSYNISSVHSSPNTSVPPSPAQSTPDSRVQPTPGKFSTPSSSIKRRSSRIIFADLNESPIRPLSTSQPFHRTGVAEFHHSQTDYEHKFHDAEGPKSLAAPEVNYSSHHPPLYPLSRGSNHLRQQASMQQDLFIGDIASQADQHGGGTLQNDDLEPRRYPTLENQSRKPSSYEQTDPGEITSSVDQNYLGDQASTRLMLDSTKETKLDIRYARNSLSEWHPLPK